MVEQLARSSHSPGDSNTRYDWLCEVAASRMEAAGSAALLPRSFEAPRNWRMGYCSGRLGGASLGREA